MKVVFIEEVAGSGNVGDVKEVKDGYARNFLLPRGLVVPATNHNISRAQNLAQSDEIRQEKIDGEATVVANKIDGASLVLTARVGEQGRLFGSITASDIAEQLSQLAGEPVDHRQVLLGHVHVSLLYPHPLYHAQYVFRNPLHSDSFCCILC